MSCATITKTKLEEKVDETNFPPQKLMIHFQGEDISLFTDSNNNGQLDEEYYYKHIYLSLMEKIKTMPNFSDISKVFTYDGKKISPLGNLLFTGFYPEGILFLGDYDSDNKFDDKLYYKISNTTNPDFSFYLLSYSRSKPYERDSINE